MKRTLIISSIALLATACNSQTAQLPAQTPTINTQEQVSQKQSDTAPKTVGWKDYVNFTNKLSFHYPPEMITVTEKEDRLILDRPETYKEFQEKQLSRIGDLIVYVDPNPKNLSFDQFYKDRDFNNPAKIKIGPDNAEAFETNQCALGMATDCVVVPDGDRFIEFTSFLDEDTFQTILSTFYFLRS